MKKRVDCPECDGEGRVWVLVGDAIQVAQQCPKCKGKKTIVVTVKPPPEPEYQPFGQDDQTEPCPKWPYIHRYPRWGDEDDRPKYRCAVESK